MEGVQWMDGPVGRRAGRGFRGKTWRHASVTDIGEGEVIVRGEPGGGEGRRSEPHSRFLSSTSCNLVKGSLIDYLEWIQRRKGVMMAL